MDGVSGSSSGGSTQSLEMVGVALAKTQQEDEGRQSLKLLESAASSSQQIQSSAHSKPMGSLGHNINTTA